MPLGALLAAICDPRTKQLEHLTDSDKERAGNALDVRMLQRQEELVLAASSAAGAAAAATAAAAAAAATGYGGTGPTETPETSASSRNFLQRMRASRPAEGLQQPVTSAAEVREKREIQRMQRETEKKASLDLSLESAVEAEANALAWWKATATSIR